MLTRPRVDAPTQPRFGRAACGRVPSRVRPNVMITGHATGHAGSPPNGCGGTCPCHWPKPAACMKGSYTLGQLHGRHGATYYNRYPGSCLQATVPDAWPPASTSGAHTPPSCQHRFRPICVGPIFFGVDRVAVTKENTARLPSRSPSWFDFESPPLFSHWGGLDGKQG